MSELVYQLQELVKTYDGKQVLHVDRLDLYRGEILAVVGPSGAGKSTLLRMLNFLEPPTDGATRFLGTECTTLRPASLALRRRVTTVFQQTVLLNRSVWANACYGLRLRGERDASHKVKMALEQVGLAGLAHRRARTLSGGEAQRVALARAMVLVSVLIMRMVSVVMAATIVGTMPEYSPYTGLTPASWA